MYTGAFRVRNLQVCTDKKHNSKYFNINNIYGTYSLLTHVGYAKLAIEFSRTSESCSHGPDPACCLKILCPFFFFRLTWLPYFKKPKHACEPPEIYSKNTPWESYTVPNSFSSMRTSERNFLVASGPRKVRRFSACF